MTNPLRTEQPLNGRRRATRLAGVTALCGLVLSATGLTLDAAPASAAPNGGACAPNDHFGRLLPDLPAAKFNDADLTNVAKFVTETTHVENVNGRTDIDKSQDESDIDAGYTYVGQFLDHDITADPRPDSLTGDIDPWSLVNSRTPQLDLDSLYGKGPAGSPELFEADGMTFKLGAKQTGSSSDPEARDLLRSASGRAMIGDGRNDENKIVASFHSIMTRFHNKIVRDVKAARPELSAGQVFEEARNQVRWYYQWAVLTDFLPQMSSQAAVNKVAQYDGSRWTTNLAWYDSCRGSIPTEFATAAYRWHTMVRNDYVVNDNIKDKPIFDGSFDPRANLAGGQPAPTDFGFDWDFYFSGGTKSAQEAYKFDNSLVPGLGILPADAAGRGPTNLSDRNLLRGNQLRLPSGQDMARTFGIPVLRDDQVIVGPALGVGAKTKALTDFSSSFAGKSPLWVYLAAESVNQAFTVSGGKITSGDTKKLRLGPVGAAIVNETFVGLLANDPDSVINHPEFKPDAAYMSTKGFTFRDIVRVGTTRTNVEPVCTTTTPKKTLLNWWYFHLLQPTTTCTTPSYPNPVSKATYTAGGTAPVPANPSAQGDKKTVQASSSAEHNGWSLSKLVDNRYGSSLSSNSMGFSTKHSPTANHSEWLLVDDGSIKTLSTLWLGVRTDSGNNGEGFPVDFTIDISTDGFNWKTVVTKTNYAKPSGTKTFSWPAQKVRYIRLTASKLRQNPTDGQYAMQFSEVGTS